jgi:hypothetical protein
MDTSVVLADGEYTGAEAMSVVAFLSSFYDHNLERWMQRVVNEL